MDIQFDVRYQVNEFGYPNMPFEPDQIITLDSVDIDRPYWLSKEKVKWFEAFFENFPNIFKHLDWWEHRKPEEMPKYLRSMRTGTIYEIEKYLDDGTALTVGGNLRVLSFMKPHGSEKLCRKQRKKKSK